MYCGNAFVAWLADGNEYTVTAFLFDPSSRVNYREDCGNPFVRGCQTEMSILSPISAVRISACSVRLAKRGHRQVAVRGAAIQ